MPLFSRNLFTAQYIMTHILRTLEDIAAQPLGQAGTGLGNLYRQAGLLGGTCTIVSQTEVGTRVEIQIPRRYTV